MQVSRLKAFSRVVTTFPELKDLVVFQLGLLLHTGLDRDPAGDVR